ncbi:MAG: glutamate 5-kinase [Eubacterium sp.]|jgi:glutamate 5-kinase|nr:glutamate 5-kinase [Eubacterium sp.]
MRIVVKVGTSTLAYPTGCLNIRHVELLVKTLCDLKNAGHEIVLVSSGAIGMGVGRLSLKGKPQDMPTKQAAASVGQCELMYTYDKLFGEYNHIVGQILLTGADFTHADRKENFENTIRRLLELGVIPIVNENDTIATDEISVGDNDTLAAMCACSTQADLLVLLSDIDGLYTEDPHKNRHAQLIPLVAEITPEITKLADGEGSGLGTGGMVTKLHAARIAMEHGVDMVIANGARPQKLYDIVAGRSGGTRFRGKKEHGREKQL